MVPSSESPLPGCHFQGSPGPRGQQAPELLTYLQLIEIYSWDNWDNANTGLRWVIVGSLLVHFYQNSLLFPYEKVEECKNIVELLFIPLQLEARNWNLKLALQFHRCLSSSHEFDASSLCCQASWLQPRALRDPRRRKSQNPVLSRADVAETRNVASLQEKNHNKYKYHDIIYIRILPVASIICKNVYYIHNLSRAIIAGCRQYNTYGTHRFMVSLFS